MSDLVGDLRVAEEISRTAQFGSTVQVNAHERVIYLQRQIVMNAMDRRELLAGDIIKQFKLLED